MKQLAFTMAFVAFLLGTAGLYSPVAAEDCSNGALTSRCTTATDQAYRGGGKDVKVIPITACLRPDLFESIKLGNGSSFFEVGFYYGKGKPEVVATVRNNRCWTSSPRGKRQHGHVGSHVVAFICCDEYCGWVGGKIKADGSVDLKPIILPAAHDPLKKHHLGGGHYDRSKLLS